MKQFAKLLLLVSAIAVTSCPAPQSAPWRSALYPEDWTPGYTRGAGEFLHDFSYAGYHNGSDVPTVDGTVFDVTEYGANNSGAADATSAIQGAIEAAKIAGGGTVFFPEGLYRCEGTLRVEASHIVLRGEGAELSRIYFTQSKGMAYNGHILFKGALQSGTEILLNRDANNRAFDVYCDDASALSPGHDVSLGWVITDAFIAEHGMTDTWRAFNGEWQSIFRRKVVAVNTASRPHRVTLDAPLHYPAKNRDNASLRIQTGYITECGIELLGISNAVAWDDAWSQAQVRAIEFEGVNDGWIRGVESFPSPHPGVDGYHLQNCGIRVLKSKRITIADCALGKAQNRGGGGCGYLFELSQSSEVLERDCAGRDGRHNFIQNWGFGTTGCVFLRCASSGSRNVLSSGIAIGVPAYCEFHHSLAMACLVDSCVLDDGWYGGNRGDESTGAGHTCTQNVYWNTSGDGLIRSFAHGHGYIIGTQGVSVQTGLGDPRAAGTGPEDYVEGKGIGASLEPRSLYEDQRMRRMDTERRG